MTDEAVFTNLLVIVLLMTLAILIDAIIVPLLLALPAIAVLVYAPTAFKWVSLPLLIPAVGYVFLYLFIRDTDPGWPFAPAERVLFGGGSDD